LADEAQRASIEAEAGWDVVRLEEDNQRCMADSLFLGGISVGRDPLPVATGRVARVRDVLKQGFIWMLGVTRAELKWIHDVRWTDRARGVVEKGGWMGDGSVAGMFV
jgi:hypothetical protein